LFFIFKIKFLETRTDLFYTILNKIRNIKLSNLNTINVITYPAIIIQ